MVFFSSTQYRTQHLANKYSFLSFFVVVFVVGIGYLNGFIVYNMEFSIRALVYYDRNVKRLKSSLGSENQFHSIDFWTVLISDSLQISLSVSLFNINYAELIDPINSIAPKWIGEVFYHNLIVNIKESFKSQRKKSLFFSFLFYYTNKSHLIKKW